MNSLSDQERSFSTANQVHPGLFSGAEQPLEATPVEGKAVYVDFSGGSLSSDAGLLQLKEIDEQIGLTRGLAAALTDPRDERYTAHSLHDLLRQTVYQIAAGYEDGNDSNSLRDDPIMKMMAGRLPRSGNALASQPTISRFQNAPSRSDLYRMGRCLADQFLASYDEAPEIIVLDFDDTDSPLHGDQQLRLFNAHYDGYCYMPLHVYEGLSGRLVTTILKPKQFKGPQLLAVVRRLIEHIRQRWPETRIVYRGDSHFTKPEVMDYLDAAPSAMYVSGLMPNAVLHRLAEPVVEEAVRRFSAGVGRERGDCAKVLRFHTVRYKAGSWSRYRRVIVKVEVTAKGTNTRFVVTNMEEAPAKRLYQKIYCGRGQAENYIKDHKRYLRSDKASCHRFQANQFRLLLHSAAYVLFDTFRRELLKGTEYATATIETLRLKLIKLGARVRELKTRIKIELPSNCPVEPVIRRSLHMTARLRPG